MKTKLLIPESPLQVLPSLAKAIGLNEAIIAHRVYQLIHDEHRVIGKWIIFSLNQWHNEFPFWSISTIRRGFTSLQDKGIIITRRLTNNEMLCILSNKTQQKIRGSASDSYGLDLFMCDWCNGETFMVNEHHYPISSVDGGEDTVRICPNCHGEYHLLETVDLYTLDQKPISAFDEVCGGHNDTE